DEAAVRDVRPGPHAPGRGVESSPLARGALRGAGAPDRGRAEPAVVRSTPLRPGPADRQPLFQAILGIRSPRSVDRRAATPVSDMAHDSARDSRDSAA